LAGSLAETSVPALDAAGVADESIDFSAVSYDLTDYDPSPAFDFGAVDLPRTADSATARVAYALQMVGSLGNKMRYEQQWPRDWDDMSRVDCSKFVQLVLERAGQGNLFGREGANTARMREIISERGGPNPYRLEQVRVGDLAMWSAGTKEKPTGHVGIVTQVPTPGNSLYSIAHVGKSGAQVTSASLKQLQAPGKVGWEKFLGFWTPPAK
jgi:hypothetical protein